MKRGKVPNIIGVSCFLIMVTLVSACSTSSQSHRDFSSKKLANSSLKDSGKSGPWRPTQKNSIPVVVNEPVQKWVRLFNGNLRSNFSRWIARLGYYGPTIEGVLDDEGVPRDLIYLAMIESGFNLSAKSHASAVGPWQFIASTGRMYGLNNGPFVDDRSDLVTASRAAARHLKDLYKIYGDWYLAFAAYNAGPGKVNQAIKRGGTTDYWRLSSAHSRLFRQETKDYVPKVLAALHIVKNYKKYGYSDGSFSDPMEFDRVTIPDATDVAAIAKSAGTTEEIIRNLNPALVIGITPPNQGIEIYIPKGAKEEFLRRYESMPAHERVSSIQYRTGKKDTLASVASHYGVSAGQIAKLNGMNAKQKITPGMMLKIPATKSVLMAYAGGQTRSSGKQSMAYYRVRKGDTLAKVARANRVSVGQVAKWNNLRANSQLRVGQKMKIYRFDAGNSGSLFAGTSYPSKQRVSGVSAIILQDEKQPIALDLPKSNKIELPNMVAQSDGVEIPNEDQPALIKINDSDVADGMNVLDAVTSSTTVAMTNVATRYESGMISPVSDATSLASSGLTTTHRPTQHTVKRGESLATIAIRYDMKVDQLKKFNGLTGNKITPNQKLWLVAKKTNSTTAISYTHVNQPLAAKVSGGNSVYVVKPRDTLSSVAKINRVTVSQLKTWNQLAADQIRVGQKLKILKGTVTTASAKTSNVASSKVIIHQIKNGETLWTLSRRYQVSVNDIKKWNKLVNDRVQPNQKIRIMAVNPAAKKQIATL